MKISKSSDPWATIIIVLTFGLFGLSVFLTGFTHTLLLEIGVLLVSVKLIRMAQKNDETETRIEQHLLRIKEQLERLEKPKEAVEA